MQKTFQLLRRGDIEGVRQILDKKPEEVNAVSGDKPKRDQGQLNCTPKVRQKNLTFGVQFKHPNLLFFMLFR